MNRVTYDLSGPRWENLDTCESVLAMPIWWDLPEVVEFDIWNPILFFDRDEETGTELSRPEGRTAPTERYPDAVPFSDLRDAEVRGFASIRIEGVVGASLQADLVDPRDHRECLRSSSGERAVVRRLWGERGEIRSGPPFANHLRAASVSGRFIPGSHEYYFVSNLAWPRALVSLVFFARSAFLTFNVEQLGVTGDSLAFEYPEEFAA